MGKKAAESPSLAFKRKIGGSGLVGLVGQEGFWCRSEIICEDQSG